MNQANAHRDRVKELVKKNTFPHQQYAAKKTFAALEEDCRTVIMAAEMQSGKSGVAFALASEQRLSLTDVEITNQSLLKDTMYLLTMPDVSLKAQANADLRQCHNVVVSNFIHFKADLDSKFNRIKPKLIIIDECHYGSGDTAVRYERVFDYIETHNQECKVVFISATPLSALLAAENEAILRKGLTTKLVFHKTSSDYYGIREMLNSGQVTALGGRSRNFLNASRERDQFFQHIRNSEQPGWALIRVPSGSAMDAKNFIIDQGFEADNIFIIGKSLTGVPQDQQIDVDQFKLEYEQSILFGKKIFAITVAGVRAGINFGLDMKQTLLASWDSTVSSVAAIVQANIGRACGYHANQEAQHFTNIHGVKAYSGIVDYLERNCSSSATDDLDGLRDEFERIIGGTGIRSLDVGTRVSSKSKKLNPSLYEYEAFETDSYLVVPGKLRESYDYTCLTKDPAYLSAISVVREVLTKDGISVKSARSVPPKSTIMASWVNGDTFENVEKAAAGGPAFEHVTRCVVTLDQDEPLSFNDIIQAGGGVDIKSKDIAVYVFSIYNQSKRIVPKTVMTMDDMEQVATAFETDVDDTIFVLFKKGAISQELTDMFIAAKEAEANKSIFDERNKFARQYA
jgi:hypothetical protein